MKRKGVFALVLQPLFPIAGTNMEFECIMPTPRLDMGVDQNHYPHKRLENKLKEKKEKKKNEQEDAN